MKGAEFLKLSTNASGCKSSRIPLIIRVLMRTCKLLSFMGQTLSSNAILCAQGSIVFYSILRTWSHRECQSLNTLAEGNR